MKKNIGTVVLYPTHLLTKLFHRLAPKVSTKVKHICSGMCLMTFGSWVALHANYFPAPHLIIDVLAYAIHGFGSAPLIKTVADYLKMEI